MVVSQKHIKSFCYTFMSPKYFQEILKLRKKINTNVQVLTHLKEKLQFVQADNHQLRAVLKEVEEKAAKVNI